MNGDFNLSHLESSIKVILRDRLSFIIFFDSPGLYDLKLTLMSESGKRLASRKGAIDNGLCFVFRGFSFGLVDRLIFSDDRGIFGDVRAKDLFVLIKPEDVFNSEYEQYLHNENLNIKLSREVVRSGKIFEKDVYLSPYSIDSADAKKISSQKLGASFKVCVSNNLIKFSYLRKLNVGLSNIFSKSKNSTYLSSKGFPVPEIYKSSVELYNVKEYDACVVKPVAGTGSRGVFIKKGEVFYDVRDKEECLGYEAFETKFRRYSDSHVIIEEYVSDGVEPVRDIKVYCFYGDTPVILEVLRIGEKNLYCEYDADGNLINTGKYRNSERFEGAGFDRSILATASKISKLIPFSFMRVDFLVSGNVIKVGELSPTPGQYSRMSNHYDHKLGMAYLQAEAKIFTDLVNGKKFDFLSGQAIEDCCLN